MARVKTEYYIYIYIYIVYSYIYIYIVYIYIPILHFMYTVKIINIHSAGLFY